MEKPQRNGRFFMLLWALNFGLMKNAMKRRIMGRIVMADRLSMPARSGMLD